jgi:Protein of unknown function (DUF1460)
MKFLVIIPFLVVFLGLSCVFLEQPPNPLKGEQTPRQLMVNTSINSKSISKTDSISSNNLGYTPPLGCRGGEPKTQNSSPDEQIFQAKLKIAYTKTTFTERIQAVAASFLGTPYVGSTLEINDIEQLVINLQGLDCWTFVECSVAIALVAEANRGDFDFFKEKLQSLRYHEGKIDGYGSRIHYFSDWMMQQEKHQILKIVTDDLGGIPYPKMTAYISNHPDSYPKLSDEKTLNDLKNAEKNLHERTWSYIPKAKVAKMESKIKEGDIVAMTSTEPDLDIAHQGFAVKKNGRIYLLHASSDYHKVMITERPLVDYLARNKGQSGIMVATFN